jgi:steroid delta-isomerase
MNLQEKIKETVANYFTYFNAADPDAIASIYAEDATVEDPVGTPPKKGKDEIIAFYKSAVKNKAKLKQTGETRVVGNEAAFAFTVIVTMTVVTDKAVDVVLPEGGMEIDVIDTMKFDEDGKVTSMRAFWGPGNIRQIKA